MEKRPIRRKNEASLHANLHELHFHAPLQILNIYHHSCCCCTYFFLFTHFSSFLFLQQNYHILKIFLCALKDCKHDKVQNDVFLLAWLTYVLLYCSSPIVLWFIVVKRFFYINVSFLFTSCMNYIGLKDLCCCIKLRLKK